jgi:hypothetical protein
MQNQIVTYTNYKNGSFTSKPVSKATDSQPMSLLNMIKEYYSSPPSKLSTHTYNRILEI